MRKPSQSPPSVLFNGQNVSTVTSRTSRILNPPEDYDENLYSQRDHQKECIMDLYLFGYSHDRIAQLSNCPLRRVMEYTRGLRPLSPLEIHLYSTQHHPGPRYRYLRSLGMEVTR